MSRSDELWQYESYEHFTTHTPLLLRHVDSCSYPQGNDLAHEHFYELSSGFLSRSLVPFQSLQGEDQNKERESSQRPNSLLKKLFFLGGS